MSSRHRRVHRARQVVAEMELATLPWRFCSRSWNAARGCSPGAEMNRKSRLSPLISSAACIAICSTPTGTSAIGCRCGGGADFRRWSSACIRICEGLHVRVLPFTLMPSNCLPRRCTAFSGAASLPPWPRSSSSHTGRAFGVSDQTRTHHLPVDFDLFPDRENRNPPAREFLRFRAHP